MYQFNVPDMTCGHCVGTIAKALKSDDPKAKVEFSLGERIIKVESELAEDEIAELITDAGYPATALREVRSVK